MTASTQTNDSGATHSGPGLATAWTAGPGADLAARHRLLMLLGSSALLLAAGPGFLPQMLFGGALAGLLGPLLGVAGLALWALAAARVGAWRKRIEWLAGAVYGGLMMSWVAYVTPPSAVWIGIGWGLYYVLAGVLLRRLLHHFGLPIATALAYTSAESLRTLIPTPLGISWIRVGHLFADTAPVRGGAAIWGVAGLGFLLAALGGLVAIAILRAPGSPVRTRTRARNLGGGLTWQLSWVLALLAAHGFASWAGPASGTASDPAVRRGPRLLLVQPGFSQERKRELNQGYTPQSLVDEQLALTLEGLFVEAAAGRTVDLVCWGESMLPLDLVHASLLEALAAGAELEWPAWDLDAERAPGFVAGSTATERILIAGLRRGEFFDPEGPAATELLARRPEIDLDLACEAFARASFVSGCLLYTEEDGLVRRVNGMALWDADAKRTGAAWKRHLVPGAEGLMGLENYAWARAWAGKLMPYVPDMRAARETGILEFRAADGALDAGGEPLGWSAAGSVCFDNGFEDVYLEGAREGGADFALVASNEAWYVESHEFDQMLALSRIWAIESGRPIARATNSGVSALIGADGSELARLRVDGRDRAVAGWLAVDVPVPAEPSRAVPLYARLHGLFGPLFFGLPWLLAVLASLFGGRPGAANSGRQSPTS